MSLNTVIWQEPEQADVELEQMGLTRAIIHEALKRAHAYAVECTENDVRVTAGFLRYAKTLRYLRDQLVPKGWVAVHGKIPSVDNPKHKFALTVGSGDEGTANPFKSPSTKHPRGMASVYAISNNGQLMLDLPEFRAQQEEHRKQLEIHKARKAGELRTWWLLLYPVGNSVRVELSLPVETKKGKITAWEKRIILGTFDLGPGIVVPEVRGYDEGPAIEVDIEAREA